MNSSLVEDKPGWADGFVSENDQHVMVCTNSDLYGRLVERFAREGDPKAYGVVAGRG